MSGETSMVLSPAGVFSVTLKACTTMRLAGRTERTARAPAGLAPQMRAVEERMVKAILAGCGGKGVEVCAVK